MAFKKGHQKVGGRKKGTPNKASKLGREVAQTIILGKAYLKALEERLQCDGDRAMEPLLWKLAFGEPYDPNRHPIEARTRPSRRDRKDVDEDDDGTDKVIELR